MTPTAADLPLTPRERLRWRRAKDAELMDAIFGRVVRDGAQQLPLSLLDRSVQSPSSASR